MPIVSTSTPVGFELNAQSYNPKGNCIADCVVTLRPNSKTWRPDAEGAVDQYGTFDVKSIRDGQRLEYSREVSISEWEADTDATLRKLMPRGATFDNTAGQLRRVVEVAAHHPHLFPVRESECWRDEDGEWNMGKRLCSKPVQVIGEYKNAYNEVCYTVRSGDTRIDVTKERLQNTNLALPGLYVYDRLGLYMRLMKEWLGQNEAQRLQFVKDEHIAAIRRIDSKMAASQGDR
jgi:hypothetical protein